MKLLTKVTEWVSTRFNVSSPDPFEDARIKLNIRLTVVFMTFGLVYALTFLPVGYYFISAFTAVSSLSLLIIPFTLQSRHRFLNNIIYFSSGLAFAAINIFGSGQGLSTAIMLWLIFVVHLAFSILSRLSAIGFGSLVIMLYVSKLALLKIGFSLPYWIPQELVQNPRVLDILVPAFYNFYLAYTAHKLFDEARHQFKNNQDNIRLLGNQVSENERQYKLLVESSPALINIHDPSGKLLFVNQAAADVSGYTKEELEGMNLKDFLLEEDRQSFDFYLSEILKQGKAEGIMQATKRSGEIGFAYFRNVIISPPGAPVKILGYGQDITELEKARKLLARHEHEMEALVSSLNDVVMLFDSRNRLIKCWAKLDGLPDPASCHGKRVAEIFELLFPTSPEALRAYEYSLQTGQRSELLLPRNIGKTRQWMRIKISPIQKNKMKLAASVHLTDMTATYENELAKKASMEKLQRYQTCLNEISLSDFSRHNTLIAAFGHICLAASKAIDVERSSVWLLSKDENAIECIALANGGQLHNLEMGQMPTLLASDYPAYFNALRMVKPLVASDAATNPATKEFTETYLRPLHIGAMLDAPILVGGKLHGVICLEHVGSTREWDNQDVGFAESLSTVLSVVLEADKRKSVQQNLLSHINQLEDANNDMRKMAHHLASARQKAEESDRLKSIFLANMSHEIRTPMNAIMGFSELLEMPGISEEKRLKFSKLIRERSQDLLSIINNILDVSKIESGNINKADVDGNINELMDRILMMGNSESDYLLKGKVEVRKINHLQPSEYVVRLDFVRLYQVLTNLLTNALKFTSNGHVTLACHLQAPRTLEFTISDTGTGIPPEKLEVIFKPFRQAHDGIHIKHGGSGLGLAICKGLVELWGGKIWVESTMGTGSAFHFTIPFKPARQREYPLELSQAKSLIIEGHKVLIIEDDPGNLNFFLEILKQEKVYPLYAATGFDALQKLTNNPEIELVLLDLGLPDMSGMEVARHLRQRAPWIKIIVVTAFAADELRKDAKKIGANAILSKPVNSGKLIDTMKEVLTSVNE